MPVSALIRSIASVSLAVSVVACGSDAPEEEVDAAPEAPAGITVENGWMALPAVSGNPAAVYFTISNGGAAETSLAGAFVAGAQSAMLHETMAMDGMMAMEEMSSTAIGAGETVTFAPGGKHVMAMNLADDLAAGGTTEATLTFATGDKVSFPVTIYAAGEMPEGTEVGNP